MPLSDIELENQLLRKLRRYHEDIISTVRAERDIINIALFNDQLQDILRPHYEKIGEIFSDQIDIERTDEEEAAIAAALSIWYLTRVPQVVNEINTTTQTDLIDSFAEADADELVRELTGREAELTALAIAAVFFKRRLRGRESTIAVTETQTVISTAEATEAEVLAGLTPSISGGDNRSVSVHKRWDTRGDDRVRPAHIAADGQSVLINDPFIVGGEHLMYPKDRNLGATDGNVINCRCRVGYSKEDLETIRRGV